MTSVTLERKQELLLEARNARLSWINSSSSPYCGRGQSDRYLLRCSDGDDHDCMDTLKSSLVGEVMENAVSIASMLYDPHLTNGGDHGAENGDGDGDGNEGGNASDQRSLTAEDVTNRFRLCGRQRLKENTDRKGADTNTTIKTIGDDDINRNYKTTIRKFCLPECSDVVYSMKNFVGAFDDNTQKLLEKSGGRAHNGGKDDDNGKGDNNKDDSDHDLQQKNVTVLSSSLQKFLQTLYSTVYLHPLWSDQNNEEGLPEDTKRSLEIFVYSKCRTSIFEVLAVKDDDAFVENRLDFLQFVDPSHLDMHCLVEDEVEGADEGEDNIGMKERTKNQTWRTRLAKPIATLESLPAHNSPSQMLSCILQAYRQVNDSLSSSDGIYQDTNKDSGGTKLAGADDLLPALILTTVAARPTQIVSTLKFIEGFASEEETRGEAGYAYTNLYCAIQFIKELDLDGTSESGEGAEGLNKVKEKSKKPSLSISPEDLRAAIKESSARNTKLSNSNLRAHGDAVGVDAVEPRTENSGTPLPHYSPIPIDEVRAARLRGEEIYAWARRRQTEEQIGTASASNDAFVGGHEAAGRGAGAERLSPSTHKSRPPPRVLPLPEGFTRNYNYMSATPDEIRMSDIPSLLNEYRTLVLGIETFLSDQTSRENEYRKEEVERARRRLEADAEEAEAAIRG